MEEFSAKLDSAQINEINGLIAEIRSAKDKFEQSDELVSEEDVTSLKEKMAALSSSMMKVGEKAYAENTDSGSDNPTEPKDETVVDV